MVCAFSTFVVFLALPMVFCMGFENVCLGPNIDSNIFMSLFVGSMCYACYLLLVLVSLSVLENVDFVMLLWWIALF